jgi:hypothetical protein
MGRRMPTSLPLSVFVIEITQLEAVIPDREVPFLSGP